MNPMNPDQYETTDRNEMAGDLEEIRATIALVLRRGQFPRDQMHVDELRRQEAIISARLRA